MRLLICLAEPCLVASRIHYCAAWLAMPLSMLHLHGDHGGVPGRLASMMKVVVVVMEGGLCAAGHAHGHMWTNKRGFKDTSGGDTYR